jgi:phosphatidylglycerophosphatase C
VVSASFEAYVKIVAASLGIDEVIATGWEVDPTQDVLTGRLAGTNVRGDAKVDLIASHIHGPCDLAYAYGNSSGDTAMLARATHPIWVGRRHMPELLEEPPAGDSIH